MIPLSEKEKEHRAEFMEIMDNARSGSYFEDAKRLAASIDGYREMMLGLWMQVAAYHNDGEKRTRYHHGYIGVFEDLEDALQSIGFIDENGDPVPKEKRVKL